MASSNQGELGETFDLLTHPHRRYVLYYLRKNSGVVAIDTLTTMLANELAGPSATGVNDTPSDIRTALRHMHLPKLADAGLITFDADTHSVELEGMNEHDQFIDEAARIDGFAPPATDD
ncbi:DUF7344 domain-containing protein [Halobacterium wangiae]|uniref:DUF7344 domain-containing protein n=1 Tax=Halobacterium wangiae TaxID=2902623 RepID=UPI001E647A1B|nr:hypothetical protein [Halobacterium wangiae]